MVKVVGIACDNYKVKNYKEKLDSEGFFYSIKENVLPGSSIIKVTTDEKELPRIGKICEELERMFNTMKN